MAVTSASIAQGVGVKGSAAPTSVPAATGEQPAVQTVSQVTTSGPIRAKLTVPAAGLFNLRAPANSGIRIFVDGALTIDATGTGAAGVEVTGILSLKPGDHLIEVHGITADHTDWSRITFAASGAEPRPVAAAAEQVDAQTAEKILQDLSESQADGNAFADTGSVALPEPVSIASLPTRSFTPFVLGGGSSVAGKVARTGGATGNSAADGPPSGLPPALSMGTSSRADRPSPFARQDVVAELPSVNSFGSGSGSAPSTPVAEPGTPAPVTPDPKPVTPDPKPDTPVTVTPDPKPDTPVTVTPDPKPDTPVTVTPDPKPDTPVTVTPDPDPVTPDPAPVTQPKAPANISPLTPPANVVLASGIQLTSISEDKAVPNTGTTLFGAVMDNALFDSVDVTITPGNRTTTVDIGPTTGQFAVRLFEEDFAAGPNVTVTLTGASSTSDKVTSQPVSYALTGQPVQDGVTQALSRLTYGATPELYARIRAIGFNQFVEEQLNPDSIADMAFLAMNPEGLLKRTARSQGDMFNSIMAHDIAHAAYSEKQLREVMGNFWSNHFFAATKDTEVRHQNILDRAYFRENAFGNFQDMLLYSARSPLMSQFLDNDQNRATFINENYGREILELHTVGVNAGYTEDDVRAVARVFTGWSYVQTNPGAGDNIAREFEFQFRPSAHDIKDKTISFLDLTIRGRKDAAGVQEGEELIAVLAQNPNTRTFVCGKIVQLLVADMPPSAFVEACAAAWESTGGEVEAMLRAILLDPAYITTAEYQRNKAKTPFEYAVSAVRAFGAKPQAGQSKTDDFYRQVREIFTLAGQPYLYFQVPTGLPEVSAAWTSSATMINAYNEMTDIAERRDSFGIDLVADITDAGLETAEEVAAYLLTIATADRFRQTEFDAIVSVLKGKDGIFKPRTENEVKSLKQAMGVMVVTPSFLLQ